MTRYLLLSLLTTVAGAAELVGSTVPPYPDGLIDQSGACIAQSRGLEHECDYSIAVLANSDGKPSVLIGARLKERGNQQKPIWIVTDGLPYPALPEGYLLAIATCQVDGKDDETIIAAKRIEAEQLAGKTPLQLKFIRESMEAQEQYKAAIRSQNGEDT